MKFSVNAIRFFNQYYGSAADPAPEGVDALAEKIGAQLGAIEEIIPFGERFKGVLIVRVVLCRKHQNSDHLNVCKIDDGGVAQNVERDEDNLVQVVCGAPNVREGLLVAWLPPGVTVPESLIKGEPFVLESRELRGEMSNGMLASARELTLGDSHDGILEIGMGDDERYKPGMTLLEAGHLDGDVVIDVENKMFTHRPDCFGWLGIARELEGIQGRPYKSPEWYELQPELPGVEAEELQLTVQNNLPELVPRFMAVAMRDVQVQPSSLHIQLDLARAGIRPINNIVDYTNFFALETGQPLHAYDYDKVARLSGGDGAVLQVRMPHEGEQIALLNGKTIQPRAEAIMIATDQQLIGIGGVMGGADTEVDEQTKNIILECATFDMYSVRRTSMTHGLFSDAVTRNTKGQSPLQNAAVIAKIADEIRRFAGGKIASAFIDDNHLSAEVRERGSLFAPVTTTADFVNKRLGSKLSAEEMARLLENVEFQIEQSGEELTIIAPFWRTDIEIPEDIVEEVGRLYGFDKLPLQLPQRSLSPAPRNRLLDLKSAVRDTLARGGANEVLTYSFVHGKLLEAVGQDMVQAFRLSNALSPDLQHYRLSLLPSLLDKVHANVKAGFDQFALFEMGKVHHRDAIDTEDGLPLEFDNLALVYAAKEVDLPGAAFYQARQFVVWLSEALGLPVVFRPATEHTLALDAPFDLSRSALIGFQDDPQSFGIVGEFTPTVRQKLKLPEKTAGFELGIGAFLNRASERQYVSLSKFPKIEQDVCLRVSTETPYQTVFNCAEGVAQGLRSSAMLAALSPVDIYQRNDDAPHKQITLRLTVTSYEKTLRDTEVAQVIDRIAEATQTTLGAERV